MNLQNQCKDLIEKMNQQNSSFKGELCMQSKEKSTNSSRSESSQKLDETLKTQKNDPNYFLESEYNRRPSKRLPHAATTYNRPNGYAKLARQSFYLTHSNSARVPFKTLDETNGLTNRNGEFFGYDWISSMLENQKQIREDCEQHQQSEYSLDQSDTFFDELATFRRNHKHDCFSKQFQHEVNLPTAFPKSFWTTRLNDNHLRNEAQEKDKDSMPQKTSDEINTSDEPEVYSFVLNQRLFPVPLDLRSAARPKPHPDRPQILKISVPSNMFSKPADCDMSAELSAHAIENADFTGQSKKSEFTALQSRSHTVAFSNVTRSCSADSASLLKQCGLDRMQNLTSKQYQNQHCSARRQNIANLPSAASLELTAPCCHRRIQQDETGLGGSGTGFGLGASAGPCWRCNQPKNEEEAIAQMFPDKTKSKLIKEMALISNSRNNLPNKHHQANEVFTEDQFPREISTAKFNSLNITKETPRHYLSAIYKNEYDKLLQKSL